ncbi:MAG: amino acid decarboxylase, partial [Bryobacterales bacterium]|nr:amino acid decarboxylase [Bryobacterales bacterium]
HYLDGAARAHSLVINPHKWLFTPIDLSAFYTRYPQVLREALSLVPEYLRTADDPLILNYMDYGVALGRRFRALKLWFVMRYFGRDRIAALIRNHIRMAHDLSRLIEADGRFELCAPAPMSLICFRLRGPDEATRALLEKLNETHGVFFSHTALHGRFVMRWAIGNIHTTWEDVEKTWELVRALAPQ